MKRLLAFLLLSASLSFAQAGIRYDNVAWFNSSSYVKVVAFAKVSVCANNASAGGAATPCSPAIQAYGDANLTQSLSTPVSADANGNFYFYVASGKYKISVCSPTACFNMKDVAIASGDIPLHQDCSLGGANAFMQVLGTDGYFVCQFSSLVWERNGSQVGSAEMAANLVDTASVTWNLTDAPANGRMNIQATVTFPAQPLDIGITFDGAPTGSLVLIRHPFPFNASIALNCANSRLEAATSATSSTVFSLQKCTGAGFSACSEFGTASFAGGGVVATFACTATNFTGGTDSLVVVSPVSPDATLGNLGGAVYATR